MIATLPISQPVRLDTGRVVLQGNLTLPDNSRGIILFAHGSGSSRHSPRNVFVAEQLQEANLGTLLIDLLTEQEEAVDQYTAHLRFDMDLLADRLVDAIDWLGRDKRTSALPVGLFGASTGGGAALMAATRRPQRVRAVVSRGGRPDLAGTALLKVRTATLLIVGGDDPIVNDLNRQALSRLAAPVKQLVVVPGATHLFEEPGTLDEVARLAADWFTQHLGVPARRNAS